LHLVGIHMTSMRLSNGSCLKKDQKILQTFKINLSIYLFTCFIRMTSMRLSNGSCLKKDQKILQTFKINLSIYLFTCFIRSILLHKKNYTVHQKLSVFTQNYITQLQEI